MKIFLLVIMLIYFLLQSMMDIEYQAVNQNYNRMMLILTGSIYLIDLFRFHAFSVQEIGTVLLTIFVICVIGRVFHIYGKGDESAFIIMLFALRVYGPTYPGVNIFLLLIAAFIAELSLTIANVIHKKKYHTSMGETQKAQIEENRANFQKLNEQTKFPETTTKGSVVAFFPYLTLGYFITVILAFLAY